MQNNTFSGRVLFGTTKGLNAAGDGVLSSASRAPQVFEFRASNLLPDEGVELGFRKVVEDPDGKHWDILGIAVGAKDYSGRRGFLGAAVAVAHKNFAAYYDGYQAASVMCSQLLDSGWDNAVTTLIQETPIHLLREQKNRKLREVDENGHVIALKTPRTWNEELPTLFALSTSQVSSLLQHNDSFVAVHSDPGADADEFGVDLLEFCRQGKEREIASVEERIVEQYEVLAREKEVALEEKSKRIRMLEEDRNRLVDRLTQAQRRPVDDWPRRGESSTFANAGQTPGHQTVHARRWPMQGGGRGSRLGHQYHQAPSKRTRWQRFCWLRDLLPAISDIPWGGVLLWLLIIAAAAVSVRVLFVAIYSFVK
ncbi:MAG: hypothetical protein WED00_00130 [Aquisalimonadaceae bacterium]